MESMISDKEQSPFPIKVPNTATIEAMKELDEGKGRRFVSTAKLFEDLGV